MGWRVFAALALAVIFLHAEPRALPPPPSSELPSVESLAPTEADDGARDVIWYEVLVWGTIRYTWMIQRGGEGRLRHVDEPERVFAVTPDEFDRIHAMMRYQDLTSRPSTDCRWGPTDGPYGSVHWRIHGEFSELGWSSGRVCSDTEFIYERLGAADHAVREMANR